VSHQPLRSENDCLNCGVTLSGRYCHQCGQENSVTQQSFWSLLKHFVYDIFHFDGKFFDTLRYLLTRPGRVPKDYIAGKRMRYLDPIRMYLFSSAVFFIVFFASVVPGGTGLKDAEGILTAEQRLEVAAHVLRDSSDTARLLLPQLLDTSLGVLVQKPGPGVTGPVVPYRGDRYQAEFYKNMSRGRVDSLIQGDGWLMNWMRKRLHQAGSRYHNSTSEMGEALIDTFLHLLPYLLFASLPFFGLLLKLLYRRRRSYFYSDHMIFTLYHYIFAFILIMVMIGVSAMEERLEWAVFDWLLFALFVYGGWSLFRGMRTFYGGSRARTLGRFLLLHLLGGIMLLLLLFLFLLISAYKI